MTAPRPAARVKAAIDAVRAAGLTIAAVRVVADGAVEVQKKLKNCFVLMK